MADITYTEARAGAKLASGLNIIVGIWTVVSMFALGYAAYSGAVWNNILSGALLMILGAAHFSHPVRSSSLSWVNFFVGIWLIVSAFLLGPRLFPAFFWNQIIVGFSAGILSLLSLGASRSVAPPMDRAY